MNTYGKNQIAKIEKAFSFESCWYVWFSKLKKK